MPTKEEMEEIAGWLSETSEKLDDFTKWVVERYSLSAEQLNDLLDMCTNSAFEKAAGLQTAVEMLKNIAEHTEGVVIPEMDGRQVLGTCIKSAMLQLYVYAAEIQLRFTLPNMMEGFNKAVDDLEVGVKDD